MPEPFPFSVQSLYHHERGRRYRPSQVEIEANSFSCPRCGDTLNEVRIRLKEVVLGCPTCRWSIHRDDLWQPDLKEEPSVRDPGEATAEEVPEDEILEPTGLELAKSITPTVVTL